MNKILSLLFIMTFLTPFMSAQDTETLYINGSEGRLYAELQKPASESGRIPLVILCHGFTGNCDSPLFRDVADNLDDQGIATLRFDFNGHGKSDGEFQNMTVLNEIQDLKNVIGWARKQPWVESISLLGHSQGGVVAGMTAGELGDSVIKNLVLMAPAAVLRDDAIRGNTQGALYDPWNIQGDYVQLPWGGYKLGKNYILTALTLPIYETSWRYGGPVLLIHGTHDRIVPYTYSERYVGGYRDATLNLIPDEDHSFSLNTANAALYASDWLKAKLKAEK